MQLTEEEIKQIILDIFIDVKSFIETKDLTYSLFSTALLGTVRYKGYVPNDIKMDIIMPRPDYDYFINNYVPKNKNIKMFDPQDCDFYHFAWAKVSDRRTTCDDIFKGYEDNSLGVNINILPVDGLSPAEEVESRKKLSRNYMINSCISRLKPNKLLSLKGNMKVLFKSTILAKTSYSLKQRDKLIDLCYKVNYDSADKVMVFANGSQKMQPIRKRWLEKTLDATFEGIPCKISTYYNKILTNEFGDYMNIPEEEIKTCKNLYKHYYYKKDLDNKIPV